MGLFDFFSAAPAQNAAQAQIAGINAGYGQLSDLYGQGNQTLASNYGQGLAPVQQNVGTANQGTQQLLALLGLGPGGSQGQQQALANTPGYQFQLDQGTQNALRNQAATGQLGSGATDLALQNVGQGLANTTYNQAVQNLQPFLGYGTQAAGQQLQGFGALGNAINQNVTTQGNAAYGAQTGIGNANANAALAPYQASGNLWNLVGNLAGSAAKAYGASQ
jgi:hypothetical protein